MSQSSIRRIVIVGGGTAGWMTAAALSHTLPRTQCVIELVESDDIGTIGVGEATIPTLHWFHQLIGLPEKQFMREARATIKLGIEFHEWMGPGGRYFHPFGRYSFGDDGLAMHRWIKARLEGLEDSFEDYSLNTAIARAGRIAMPSNDPGSLRSTVGYAYHMDASLYAKCLRKRAEADGVLRHEGIVVKIDQDAGSGFVTAVTTNRGETLSADLFIDCTGMRALLIEGTLKTGFEDWSHWLPCDRALAVQSERAGPAAPYTRSTARRAGWQWCIPLQHRTGNGYVYSSEFISDDEAASTLMSNLDGKPLSEPRPIRFQTGRRKKAWNKNVVAIGLSSGFLEPLESTSIHLIQSGIAKLLSLFPDRGCDELLVEQYNRIISDEILSIRDFLVLHYHATANRPEPMWARCRDMALPETLIYREDHFRRGGRIVLGTDELFREASWFAVFMGQGIHPSGYHPLVALVDSRENVARLTSLKEAIRSARTRFPLHDEFLLQNGVASQAPA